MTSRLGEAGGKARRLPAALFLSRLPPPALGKGVLAFAVFLAFASVSLGGAVEGAPPAPRLPLGPAGNWWNLDITRAPVDPNSDAYIAFINNGSIRHLHPDFGGDAGGVNIYGFPYAVVWGGVPLKAVSFSYYDESDGVLHPGSTGYPFYPIPDEAITQPHWIEGGEPGNQNPGGDRHMLIYDRDHNWLYELYALYWNGTGWQAGSGAFFDLNINGRRPDAWTSADAAGLAILPGLVRYDEVYGPAEIRHAFRVTLRASNGYVYPASHAAGSNASALPMGARLRLKASKDISGFSAPIQKIFRAMKTYGLIMADNGTDMFISGTYDVRWNNDILNPAFGALSASDFEVVQLGYMPQVPSPLAVDAHTGTGTLSNGNGVLEPGETVLIEPTWTFQRRTGATLTGSIRSFTGPAGAVYSVADGSAAYGNQAGVLTGSGTPVSCRTATGDCYRVSVSAPASRPALHWDATLEESLSTSGIYPWKVHVGGSFSDVARTHPFYRFIETILHNGLTAGCGAGGFCPDRAVTRGEMAVFLVLAEHGAGYAPPPATGTVFADVPATHPFAAWIEQLAHEGLTAGCGGGYFCPSSPVTRAQVAVFLLAAEHGVGYAPPAATGVFADVPATDPFAPWIEQLHAEGISAGCSASPPLYCPTASLTRGQMAVYLTQTFRLALYGP